VELNLSNQNNIGQNKDAGLTGNVNLDVHQPSDSELNFAFLGPVPDFSQNTALKELRLNDNELTGEL
jgi:hypothetical protein